MGKNWTLKLQILFGNISNVSILLRKLYLLNKKLLFLLKLTNKLKPTQLTAVMINSQDMLNVLLSKSTVMMLNLLTMLNVFTRKLNQLTVTMKLTLVKVPAEELLVELGKVVKAVNLNLNLVRKMTNQSLVRKDQKENLVRKDQKEI